MIKEDARIVKTKRKLLSTFRTLIKEKSFEDITVNEICEAANVRRATFYKHFPDKLAFLKFFVGSLRSLFEKRVASHKKYDSDYEYYIDYLTSAVHFLSENEDIVNNALASNVLPVLLDVIMQKNYEDTCARLHESVKHGMVLRTSVETTAAMIVGGVSQAILNWYTFGKKQPIDELIAEMTTVLIGMMR